jgi:hypothetical protein
MILPTAFLVVYQRQRHRQRSALIGTEYSAQITIQDFDGVIDTHFVLNILKRYDILKKNFLIKNVIEQPGPVITGQVPAVTGQVPAVTGQVPAVTGQVPAVTGQVPAVTGQVPVDADRCR